MSVNGGEISVVLTLEDGQYRASLRGAGAQAEGFARRIASIDRSVARTESRVRGFVSTLRDWTLIIGQARNALNQINFLTTGWMTNIVKANAEVERMTFLMKGLSSASDDLSRMKDATETVGELFDMAKKAPFQVNALSDSFVKMKSVGIDPLTGPLAALVDGVSAFGGTSEILHRASIAIQQMAGKGVISMEELRQQMGEAVPRSIELMARSMGVSYGEMVDQIANGNVEARHALAAMFGEFERVFGGRAEALMESFNGQWAKFLTNLTLLKTQSAGMKEFFALVTTSLRDLNAYLESPAAKNFASDLGEALSWIVTSVRSVIETMIEWRGVILNLGAALIGALAIKGLISAYAVFRARIIAVTAAMRTQNAAMANAALAQTHGFATAQRLAGGYATLNSSALRAATGIRAVGVAIGGLLGPIGLAVSGLFALASALDIFGSSHKRALAAIAEGRMIASEEELKEREAAVRDLAEDLEDKIALRDKLQSRLDRARPGTASDDRGRAKLRQDIADLNAEIGTLQGQIAKTDDLLDQQIEGWRDLISTGVAESMMTVTRQGLTKLNSEYDEAMKTITETTESRSKERIEATIAAQGALYEGSIGLYQSFIDEQRSLLEQGLAQDAAAVEKAIAVATGAIVQLRERQEAAAEAARTGLVLTSGGKGDKGAETITNKILNAQQEFAERSREIMLDSARLQQQLMDPLSFQMPESIDALQVKLEGVLEPLARLAPKSAEAAKALAELRQQIGGLVAGQAENELKRVMIALGERTREIRRSLMGEDRAREAAYNEEVERIGKMKQAWLEQGIWRVEHEEMVQEALKALRDQFLEDSKGPLDRWADEWKETAKNVEQWMADSFRGMSQELANFITEGEIDLGNFARNMLNTFLQIQINSAFSAIFKGFQNAGGGGGIMQSILGFLGFHGGGIVGKGEQSFTRQIALSPAEIATLPKFHTGGVADDEMLAVLKKDEGVFTPEQMRALGSGMGGADVQVNVINATRDEVEVEKGRPRFDGDRMIMDVVLRNASRPGNFRDSLRSALA